MMINRSVTPVTTGGSHSIWDSANEGRAGSGDDYVCVSPKSTKSIYIQANTPQHIPNTRRRTQIANLFENGRT